MPLKVHQIIDSFILIIALISAVALIYMTNIPPVKRGFICNDPYISYPYKKSSISNTFMLLHLNLILIFTVSLTEFLLSNEKLFLKRLQKSMKSTHKFISRYLLCWALMIIPFMFVKKMTGVLRPHFLDLCKPNVTDCETGSLVIDFTCTNENLTPRKASTIMQSFPSGHAALSVYFSTFLIIYFHKRLSSRSNFIVPFVQGTLLIFIAICCSSRISDNAHHAIDVLFGAFVGLLCALFASVVMCKNFKAKIPSDDTNGINLKENVQ